MEACLSSRDIYKAISISFYCDDEGLHTFPEYTVYRKYTVSIIKKR